MASREPEPGRRGWRREGGPTIWEFALAIALVVVIAALAFVVFGSQTSEILSVVSGTI